LAPNAWKNTGHKSQQQLTRGMGPLSSSQHGDVHPHRDTNGTLRTVTGMAQAQWIDSRRYLKLQGLTAHNERT